MNESRPNQLFRIKIKPMTIEGLALGMFFAPRVFYYINDILSTIGSSISSNLLYVAYIAMALLIYFRMAQHNGKKLIITFFFYGVVILFSLLLSPGIIKYLRPSATGYGQIVFSLLIYVPIFLAASSMEDNSFLLKKALKYSEVTLLLVVLCFFLRIVVFRLGNVSADYMTFAYYSLPSIFICFYCGLRQRRISLILAIIGSLIVLVGGCRGALVTLIVFFAVYYFTLTREKGTANRIIVSLFLIVVAGLVYLNLGSIFTSIATLLSRFEYSSRTFLTLAGQSFQDTDSFLDMGGRAVYWEKSLNNISFLGMHGVFGDRLLLNGSYPHNILLEMMLNYGGLFGLIIFLGLCYKWFKAYHKATSLGDAFIIWCVSAFVTFFVKMMMSASYLTASDFWFYLGIIFWIAKLNPGKIYEDDSNNKLK